MRGQQRISGNDVPSRILYGDFPPQRSLPAVEALVPGETHWHGLFEAGYLPSQLDTELERLEQILGAELCCLWELYDPNISDYDLAFSGGNELAIVIEHNLYPIPDDMFQYLIERADVSVRAPDPEEIKEQFSPLNSVSGVFFPNGGRYNAVPRASS